MHHLPMRFLRIALGGFSVALCLAGCDPTVATESIPASKFSASTSSGSLDSSFGSGQGFVSNSGAAGGSIDTVNALTFSSGGGILATGFSSTGTQNQMALWGFNADGSPDVTFGTSGPGYTVRDDPANPTYDVSGSALATDSVGGIVVIGSSLFSTTNGFLMLWRYDSTGALDFTFGSAGATSVNGGVDTPPPPSVADYGIGLALDPSDNILATGDARGSCFCATFWRFDSAGIVDTTFNTTGHNFDGPGNQAAAFTPVQGPIGFPWAGEEFATGFIPSGATPVWHLDASGNIVDRLDSFANSGGAAIVFDALGRLVLVGNISTGLMVSRIDVSTIPATIDTTFATNGVVGSAATGSTTALTGENHEAASSVTIDSQGRIVVAGYVGMDPSNIVDYMAVWRFLSDGTPDATFTDGQCRVNGVLGGCVVFTQTAKGGTHDVANIVRVDSADRILIGGRSDDTGGKTWMVVWRINP